MDWLIKIIRKYEKISIVLISIILTVSFMNGAIIFGNILKDYTLRITTYIVFALAFLFVLAFKKEILKNGQ